MTFRTKSGELSLKSLYASHISANLAPEKRDQQIVDHIARLLAEVQKEIARSNLDWEEAKPLLRPQLAPSEYLRKGPILSFPFLDDVLVALVLDFPESYAFVTNEDGKA